MNGIYVFIVFLCVQELTTASYYRIPKRYFKKQRQEVKQAKHAPVKIPTRTIPLFVTAEQPTQNKPEITNKPETKEQVNAKLVQNIVVDATEKFEHINSDVDLETSEVLDEIKHPETEVLEETKQNTNIDVRDDKAILKTPHYLPLIKYELPKMTALPILTLLPIVATLPVVNVGPKLQVKLHEILPEVIVEGVTSYLVDEEFEDDEFEEDAEESSVTVNILQEVKYEITKREQQKSPILHKVHRIEEFKRNIILDRREDPRNERVGERDGNMDLKEYMQRIAVRADLQKN